MIKQGLSKTASSVLLAFAVLVISILAPPNSRAQSSGTGDWNLLLFGNYDFVSPNTGNVFPNLPASYTSPTWNKYLSDGYGGGVGVAYWFTEDVAFRIMAQASEFNAGTSPFLTSGALESAPLTGGVEIKLYGDPDYFLYLAVDGGVAYENALQSQGFFAKSMNHAWSSYADAGIGLNIDWVFIEVKVAYLPDAQPNSSFQQGALWYVPVTAGFNF